MFSPRQLLASALVLAAACLPLTGLSGCSNMGASAAASFTPMPDLQSAGLRQLWEHQVPLLPGEHIVHVWRVGDSIYVTGSEAHIARLSASEGTLKWQRDLGNSQFEIFRPADAPDGKNVLVLNHGKAFLFDKLTGDTVMERNLSMAVKTDPIIVGNAFCIGGVECFRAFDIDNLTSRRWVTRSPNDLFVARPVVEGDSILLASQTGLLWRINDLTGDWIWKDRKTNGQVVGGLAADGRAVYIPCLDGKVYAFDLNSGQLLWNPPLEGRLDRALSVTRSEVLVPATGKGLYSLNSARGDVKWFAPGVNEIGTIVRDRVWVSDRGDNLMALSLDTGEVLAKAQTTASVVTNTVDQMVILVNSSGVVGAYTSAK